ncbi:C4-dicarboxylate ABC transporter permease, partial [Billgrantia desiderata SP1]
QVLMNVLMDTVRTTAMLFAVVLTALIFANFINRAGLPNDLLAFVNGLNIAPFMVILVILAIYVLLGCVFESMSMLLLTVPVFFPVVAGLGFDLVWFGILVVIVIEISLITPPVGMNVFVLRAV